MHVARRPIARRLRRSLRFRPYGLHHSPEGGWGGRAPEGEEVKEMKKRMNIKDALKEELKNRSINISTWNFTEHQQPTR
jgi:hypothetical protein